MNWTDWRGIRRVEDQSKFGELIGFNKVRLPLVLMGMIPRPDETVRACLSGQYKLIGSEQCDQDASDGRVMLIEYTAEKGSHGSEGRLSVELMVHKSCTLTQVPALYIAESIHFNALPRCPHPTYGRPYHRP